jgi:hypothetical protein
MPGTPSIVMTILFAKALSMIKREGNNDLFKTGLDQPKLDLDEF